MTSLKCIVVTPEITALERDAEFIALPLYDGEIGISPGHSPMVGRLGFGEMRVTTAGQSDRFYVDGGFVQVVDNVVSVLTNRTVAAGEIDATAAAAQLEEARKAVANSDEALQIRDRAVDQARAQIRVAQRAS